MYSPPPPPSQDLLPTSPCNMSLLQMQYHLEKEDVYHREQPNLQFYYDYIKMFTADPFSNSQFFNWLDYGNGSTVDLPGCRREKLNREHVTYLLNGQRKPYRVLFDNNGRFVFKHSGKYVNTRSHEDTIYVLSPKWKFYVADKVNRIFHHSSFMGGGDVYCAGHLHVSNGLLKTISFVSGHYKPRRENLQLVRRYLQNSNADLKYANFLGL